MNSSKLLTKIQELQRERDKAIGIREEAMKQLKKLGFSTIEKAEQKIKELEKEKKQNDVTIQSLIQKLRKICPELTGD